MHGQDLNWTVNAWTLPCERRAPLAADSAGLSALVRLARACLLPAMVGLLLCYLDRPLRCLRRWAGRRAVRRATHKARARGGDEEGKEEEGGAGRRGLRPRLFVKVLVAGREEEEAVEVKVRRHVDCLSSVMGGGRLGKALAGVVVEVHLASPPSQAMVEGLSSHLNVRTVVVDGRQEGGRRYAIAFAPTLPDSSLLLADERATPRGPPVLLAVVRRSSRHRRTPSCPPPVPCGRRPSASSCSSAPTSEPAARRGRETWWSHYPQNVPGEQLVGGDSGRHTGVTGTEPWLALHQPHAQLCVCGGCAQAPRALIRVVPVPPPLAAWQGGGGGAVMRAVAGWRRR